MGCNSSCRRAPPCHERMKRVFTNFFWRYGQVVCKHPTPFIVLPILLCTGLGFGIFTLEVEKDTETLFYPRGTQAIKDRTRLEELFPDLNKETYSPYAQITWRKFFTLLFEVKKAKQSVFAPEVVSEMWTFLLGLQSALKRQGHDWQKVCAKFQNSCVIEGGKYLLPGFLSQLRAGNVTYPLRVGPDGVIFDLSLNIGDAVTSKTGILRGARALTLIFVLYNDTGFSDAALKLAQQTKLKHVDITYEGTNTLKLELYRATKGDVWLFILTLVACVAFAILSTMGGDMVSTRSLLAFVGVLAAVLGIVASIGFLSLCGLKYANIVGITPYLVIGIGVDDMFLLMSSWSETLEKKDLSVTERVSTTLTFASVGITITSLTDFLAFLVGGSSVFFSVQIFCIYTGIAVLFVYLCQITLFVACLSLHGRRVYSGRHCLTCLLTKSRKEMKEKGWSIVCRFLCGGSVPTHSRDDESLCERVPRLLLPKVIFHRSLRCLILIAFGLLFAASVYGYAHLEQGIDYADLVREDSYYRAHIKQYEKYFPYRIPVALVMDGEVNYASGAVQRQVRALLRQAKQDQGINTRLDHCWLSHYLQSPYYNSSRRFYSHLPAFLKTHPIYIPDIRFSPNKRKIVASRCYVITQPSKDKIALSKLMQRMRSIAENSGFPVRVFPFHWSFMTFEGVLQILPNTLWTLGIAVGAMVVVCLIFLPHPFMVILVTFNIMMIIANIFAFMYYWGITLSVITMIHLIMSVGFSVDFSAHVCSAYLMSDSLLRHDRAYDAITHAASPIFNGGMSSFVGVILLLFSGSYIFMTFFKIMLLVIVFGMLNAILFVPTVLSLIGPENFETGVHRLDKPAAHFHRKHPRRQSTQPPCNSPASTHSAVVHPTTEATSLTRFFQNPGPELMGRLSVQGMPRRKSSTECHDKKSPSRSVATVS